MSEAARRPRQTCSSDSRARSVAARPDRAEADDAVFELPPELDQLLNVTLDGWRPHCEAVPTDPDGERFVEVDDGSPQLRVGLPECLYLTHEPPPLNAVPDPVEG